MSLTVEQVQAELEPEEPNYRFASRLGPAAGPHLLALVRRDDPRLAARAAYLAGFIGGADSIEAVVHAAVSAHEVVRVAAAAVLARLDSDGVDELVTVLMHDPDVGVRKAMARALALGLREGTLEALERMEQEDPEAGLRAFAGAMVHALAAGPKARRAGEATPSAAE